MKVMLAVFVVTLFFAVFFPDDGTCDAFVAGELCEQAVNKATGSPLCLWTQDPSLANGGSCALSQPPSSMTFNLIVVTVLVVVSFPLDFLFDVLFNTYAINRPDLSQLGFFNPEVWLGRSSNIALNVNNYDNGDIISESHNNNSNNNSSVKVQCHSNCHEVPRDVYSCTKPCEEEVEDILTDVKRFLDQKVHRSGVASVVNLSVCERATLNAVVKYLGISPDSSSIFLPLRQVLWYGGAKQKLLNKLRRIRDRQRELQHTLTNLGDLDPRNKDAVLIRSFVVEQFGLFKQYIMRVHYGGYFSDATAPAVNPICWLATWALCYGSLLFFLYYLFNWGVTNGTTMLQLWAFTFSFTLLQDLTAVQLLQILILYILSMVSVRPQLKYINQVLQKAAISLRQQSELQQQNSLFAVVQRWSPSCRVARMESVAQDLVAAKVLRSLGDYDIIVCRSNNDVSLAALVLVALSIPIAVGAMNEALGEAALGSFISNLLDGFLLFNNYLLSISVGALVAPYLALLALYLVRFYVAPSALKELNRQLLELERRKNYSKDGTWRTSLRVQKRVDWLMLWQLVRRAMFRKMNSLFTHWDVLGQQKGRCYYFKLKDPQSLLWANMNSSGADISLQSLQELSRTVVLQLKLKRKIPQTTISSDERGHAEYVTQLLNTTLVHRSRIVESSHEGGSDDKNHFAESYLREMSVGQSSLPDLNLSAVSYYWSCFSVPKLHGVTLADILQDSQSSSGISCPDAEYVIYLPKKTSLTLDATTRQRSLLFKPPSSRAKNNKTFVVPLESTEGDVSSEANSTAESFFSLNLEPRRRERNLYDFNFTKFS